MDHTGGVLTAVAYGAGLAAAIGTCVTLAQDRGWTVQVTAAPAALGFFDAAAIADQAGRPVRSQYARPGAPRSVIPDAILVAPAIYNTICKWAQGISRWLRSYGNGSDSLASDTPVQDAIPLTNQHFRVEVQIFLSAVHRPFIAFWHPPPRSLQMIMNR
jgi:hypothetical protein